MRRIPIQGGPLSGQDAPDNRIAFPWPEGWYYNSHWPDRHGQFYYWREEGWIDPDCVAWVAEVEPWLRGGGA